MRFLCLYKVCGPSGHLILFEVFVFDVLAVPRTVERRTSELASSEFHKKSNIVFMLRQHKLKNVSSSRIPFHSSNLIGPNVLFKYDTALPCQVLVEFVLGSPGTVFYPSFSFNKIVSDRQITLNTSVADYADDNGIIDDPRLASINLQARQESVPGLVYRMEI